MNTESNKSLGKIEQKIEKEEDNQVIQDHSEQYLRNLNEPDQNQAFIDVITEFNMKEQLRQKTPKDIYEEQKIERNIMNLLQLLQSDEFWAQGLLPLQLKGITQIMAQLDEGRFFLILDIGEYSYNRIQIPQFTLLKMLLEIKFFSLNEQIFLEKTIGSLLLKQVFEFEYYLDQSEIDNQYIEKFQEINSTNCSEYLDSYLKEKLSINSVTLTFSEIDTHLEVFIRQNGDIDELYYKVVVYYWSRFCQKSKEGSSFLDFEKKSLIEQYYFNRFINNSYSLAPEFMSQFVSIKGAFQGLKDVIQKIIDKGIERVNIGLWSQVQKLSYQSLNLIVVKNLETKILLKILWMNKSDGAFAKVFQERGNYDFNTYYQFLINNVENQEYLIRDLLTLKQIEISLKASPHTLLNPFNYYEIFENVSTFFTRKQLQRKFPQSMEINLESFNTSLAEINEEEMKTVIDDWTKQMNNQEAFRKLIPFYFNIIKRGEQASDFTSSILSSIWENRIPSKAFNVKALFQILYNNSNEELQIILLRFHSQENPIPLIYQNLQIFNLDSNLFTFNHNIFYIFPKCYTIINFSFSKSRYGKTSFINEVFYKKFAILDDCEINKNTVDLMFDFNFRGSRKLALADIHGNLPLPLLKQILSLFQLWIIQLNTELELLENYSKLEQILLEQALKPTVCFVIRNSTGQNQEEIQKIKEQGFYVYCVEDITQSSIEQRISIIKDAQKFFYDIIYNCSKDHKQKYDFLNLMQQFTTQTQFQEFKQRIQELKLKLKEIRGIEEGFFSPQAFPIRFIEYQITQKQNKISLLGKVEKFSSKVVQQLSDEIQELNKKQIQEPSCVLKIFYEILKMPNFYGFYLLFKDMIQQFDKKTLKQVNTPYHYESLQELKNNLQKYQKQLELKTVNIECFWRETIKQWLNNKQVFQDFDLVDIVYQLIKKGEPFELFNREDFTMSKQFFHQLSQKFNENNERVIIISSLGEQNSGKSTILNKIFGCHFNKQTKGINLQLLRVQNNMTEFILILDTMGIKNTEFDKKVSLFILAVSDIILFCIKGDLLIPSSNLIKDCIQTLSSISDSPNQKHITWCFNEIDQEKNIKAFKNQIVKTLVDTPVTNNYIDFVAISSQQNILIFGLTAINNELSHEWQYFEIVDSFSRVAIKKFNIILKKFQQRHGEFYQLKDIFFRVTSIQETMLSISDLQEYNEQIDWKQNSIMMDFLNETWLKERALQDIDIRKELKQFESKQFTKFDLDVAIQKTQAVIKDQLNLLYQNLKEQFEKRKGTLFISKKNSEKCQTLFEKQINQEMLEYNFFILKEKERILKYQLEKNCKQTMRMYFSNLSLERLNQENPSELQLQCEKQWKQFNQDYNAEYHELFCVYHKNLLQTLKLTKISQTYPELYKLFENETIALKNNQFHEIYGDFFEAQLKQQVFFEPITQHQHLFRRDLNSNMQPLDILPVSEFYQISRSYIKIKKVNIITYIQQYLFEDLFRLINQKQIDDEMMYGYFSILDLFNVHYQDLDHIIGQIRQNRFQDYNQFISKLQFSFQGKILENNFFVKNYNIYYKQLKSEIWETLSILDDEQQTEQILEEYVLIRKKKELKPKENNNKIFQYILFPQVQFQQEFQQQFPTIFNQKMLDSSNGWKLLFTQIYDYVMQELTNSENVLEIYISKKIIKGVENKIIGFNKQFMIYRLILNQKGVKIIKLFSKFVIYLYFCHRKWKKLQESLSLITEQELSDIIIEKKEQIAIILKNLMLSNFKKNEYYSNSSILEF